MRFLPTSLRAAAACAAVFSTASFVACGQSAETQQRLAQLEAVSAEKDSLLVVAAENTRLMSDISAEIARVQAPAAEAGSQEAPVEVTRERILADIQKLTTRLQDAETRLVESEQRVDAIAKDNTTLQGSVATFRKTVADLRTTLENQKLTIASLTGQVEQLREENTRLVEQNVTLDQQRTVLADSVVELDRRNNTVFYIVGTKDELIQRGVVTEEGGSRVLFVFGKRGKTLVPARELDSAAFTAIDLRAVREIPLPWADRPYRIVSRQDLAALETPPDDDGVFRGVIRIADPDRFWANARHLILVEG